MKLNFLKSNLSVKEAKNIKLICIKNSMLDLILDVINKYV